ncbi:MAG: hypothetical protein HY460_02495, partial [Parcubacteria group bacterium]|nr:hypothetical protein [Parcubacteria group bacterium]
MDITRFSGKNNDQQESADSSEAEYQEYAEYEVGASSSEEASAEKQSFLAAIPWERIGLWCLIAYIFLLPLFFLPATIFPVHYGKQLLAVTLLGVAFLAWLCTVLRDGVIRYPRSALNVAFWAILAVAVLSLIFAGPPVMRIRGVAAEEFSVLNIAIYALGFFLAAITIRKASDFRIALVAVIASGGILGAISFLQTREIYLYPWSFARTVNFNSIGSPYKLAAFLGPLLVLLVGLVPVMFRSRWAQALAIIGAVFAFLAFYSINLKIAWIVFLVGMAAFTVCLFVQRGARKINIALVLTALAALAVFTNIHPTAGIQQPAFPFELRPNAKETLSITRSSLSGSRALVGSGPATFGYQYTLHRNSAELNKTPFWGLRFLDGHSSFLTFVAEFGLLGFIAVILLAVGVLSAAYRAWRMEEVDYPQKDVALALAA